MNAPQAQDDSTDSFLGSGTRAIPSPAIVQRAFGRYEFGSELGRGSTGTVYEGRDLESGAIVAIKTISSLDPENLFRLKHEFRSLANLEHENFVRFGELACERGQWFFTMERVYGTSFVQYVRPGGKLEEMLLRASLVQLVEGLEALHEAGRIHRDVKPSNVLVTDEGRVVLLDFGLISGFDVEDGIRGTPAYMAPEQIEAANLTPAVDWYAVGVMLFEALWGELPFRGESGDIMSAKLLDETPVGRSDDVPSDLHALCLALLQRDPAARPGISDIRARLQMRSPAAQLREAFVGRERELGLLRDAFSRARSALTRVVVGGEAGMGKSALVERFLAELPAQAVVLRGRCYEQESVPFGGADSLVDALSEYLLGLDAADVRRFLSGGVTSVARAFPVLTRVRAIAAESAAGPAISPAAVRDQAFAELSSIVATLARSRLLVIFLDDLQWLGSDGLALIRAALSSVTGRCMLVATLRTGAALGQDVAAFLESFDVRVDVGRLTPEESVVLCEALSDGDDASVRDAVLREAGGVPIFLAELLRSARTGKLSRHANARLQDVLNDRVAERDDVERRFIEMTALAAAPTPYATLARAAGLDVGECLTRLARLRAVHLVRLTRIDGERCVEPYHDRLREAVMERLRAQGPQELARQHLALGRALRGTPHETPAAPRIFAVVQHMNLGRDQLQSKTERRDLAELNLVASREATRATTYDRAREYARVGLECLGTGGGDGLRRDLIVARMEGELLDEDRAAARRSFAEARALAVDPQSLTTVCVAWLVCQGLRNPRESLDLMREPLAALGAPLPPRFSMARVMAEFMAARWAQGGRSPEVLDDLPLMTDERAAAATRIAVALLPNAYFLVDEPTIQPWMLTRLARLSLRHGLCESSSYTFGAYAISLTGMGKHREAAAFGRLSSRLVARFDNPTFTVQTNFLVGFFTMPLEKPFAAAEEFVAATIEGAAKTRNGMYEDFARQVFCACHYLDGRALSVLHDAVESSRKLLRRSDILDSPRVMTVFSAYATAWMKSDVAGFEREAAMVSEAQLFGGLKPFEAVMARYFHFLTQADIAFLRGDLAAARAAFGRLTTVQSAAFGSPNQVELQLLSALIAARSATDGAWVLRGRALPTLLTATRKLDGWAEACPDNFEPHALIARAELARVLGRSRAAAETYDRAIESAARYGAAKREAVACELAATHARTQGDGAAAASYLARAVDAYRRWGAVAKVAMLEGASGRA